MEDRKRKKAEEKQDETVEDSFPASDPPSTTPITGVGGHADDEKSPDDPQPDQSPGPKKNG